MDIGNDNVFKLVLKFSVPAVTGMLVNALYNMVDRIFISYGVGSDAFSGLTVTGPVTIVLLAFSMLVGLGAAPGISMKLGEGKKDEAEKILGNAFFMLLVTSFVIMGLGLVFLRPILFFFGASDITIEYAVSYMRVILLGYPFMTLSFGLYHMTRASGNPTRAMFSMILGAVANIVLDAVFIFVFGWGIWGAAFATIISQAASMVWILTFFIGTKNIITIKVKNFRPDIAALKRIYSIGISPFFTQIAQSGLGAIVNNRLLKFGGDDAIGAFGAIHMVIMLFAMPMFGMNQGAQPVISYNYGAKKYHRSKSALIYTVIMAFTVGVIGWIFTMTMAETVINFFTNGHEGINSYAIKGLKIMMLLFPIGCIQIVSAVFFQAIGKAKITLFLSLLRQVILLIPLYYILPVFFGIDGIWMSMPIADTASCIITMVVVSRGLNEMLKEADALTPNANVSL